ncbi:hypothetical protein GF362_04885 [Candidatus Dojkabacteria bacterium]|nr:hypothetical protein [Candidatus Dojkabacteria bacterium]
MSKQKKVPTPEKSKDAAKEDKKKLNFLYHLKIKLKKILFFLKRKLKSLVNRLVPAFIKKLPVPIKFALTFLVFILVSSMGAGAYFLIDYLTVINSKPQNLEFTFTPTVTQSSIFNDALDIKLEERIYLTFKEEPDLEAIEMKLKEDMDENIIVEETENSKEVGIHKEGGWEPDKEYEITLSKEEFEFLEKDFFLSFKTQETPQVVLTNLEGYVDPKQKILLSFNTDVFDNDKQNNKEFLHFEPAIEGKTEIISPTSLRFIPKNELELNQSIKLRINAEDIQNSFGLSMEEDYEISFVPGQTQKLEEEESSYVDYIKGSRFDVKANSKDSIVVIVDEVVNKNSFKQETKIWDASTEIPYSISWKTVSYDQAEKEVSYFYDYSGKKKEKKYLVADITPHNNWDEGKNYQITISKSLKSNSGVEMTRGYKRTISIPGKFEYLRSNITNNVFNGGKYRKNIQLDFSNEMVYSTEELKNLIKLTALTGKKGEMNIYAYTGYYYADNDIQIEADLREGNRYRLWVSPELMDMYGNKLGKALEFEFEAKNVGSKSLLNIFGKRVAYIDNNGTYRVLLESMHLNDIKVELAKIAPEEFVHAEEGNRTQDEVFEMGDIVQTWTKHFENFEKSEDVKYGLLQFQYPIGNVEDGLYIIRAKDQSEKYRDYRLLIISQNSVVIKKTNDKTIAWVANSQTGNPVADQPLILRNGGQKISATTDAKGVAVFQGSGKGKIHIYSEDGRIFVSSIYDDGMQKYDYVNSYYYNEDTTIHYVYFDRPIYKADQDVHFKVFTRRRENNTLSIQRDNLEVEVQDESGNSIYNGELEVTDFGTAYDTFHLDKKLDSGLYYMYVNGQFIDGFRISAYQIFNYSFTASVDEKEIYSVNDEVDVEVDAYYYFGEPLADADVEVNLYVRDSSTLFFDKALRGDYKHFSFPGLSDHQYNWDYDDYLDHTDTDYNSEKAGSMTVKTDKNGKAKLSVPIEVSNKIAYGSAKILSVEVKVRDHIGMEEYKTFYKSLSPKGGFIGINNKRYYVSTQDATPYKAEIVYFNSMFKEAPGQSLNVDVIRKDRRQVKRRRESGVYYWDWVEETKEVYSTVITTDSKGRAIFTYNPEVEGDYEVKVSSSSNSRIKHSVNFYAYDYNYGRFDYYFAYTNDVRSVLKTNKAEYNVGDTAVLTPQLPGPNYMALVTLERDTILEYDVVNLNEVNNLNVKITQNLQPNFYYSFVAFSPHDMGAEFLDLKMGLTEIKVATSGREIKTTIETDKERYYPGENVELSINTNSNKSVEYAIAVVDKAIIDLSKVDPNEDLAKNLVQTYWTNWNLGVTTASNLAIYENKLIAKKKWGNKGGSGDGGGGGPSLQIEDIRRNFEEVALWIPAEVARDGNLTLDFEVPDNLTTWAIAVVGITKDTSFAVAIEDIVVSNDVNIIAGLPPYLSQSDKSKLIYNASFTDKFIKKELGAKIEVDNARIKCGDKLQKECFSKVTSEDFPVEYNFYPDKEGEAKVRFGVTNGNQILDAEERTIRINDDAQVRNEIFFGDTKDQNKFSFIYPNGHQGESKKLKVVLSDKIVGDLSKIKNYFTSYQNKCSEQTSSTIQALVPYADDERVKGQINKGIQRLYVLQNDDGGWGVWEDGESLDYNSVYAYFTLKYLESAEFNVDKDRLKRGEDYILGRLGSMEANKPFALSILADVEKFDINAMNSYYDANKDGMSLINKAYILNAFNEYVNSSAVSAEESDAIQAKIDHLQNVILNEMRLTDGKAYWQDDAKSNYYYYNNNIKTTSVILDVLLDLKGDDLSLVPIISYLKYELATNEHLGTQSNIYIFKALEKAKKIFKLDLENSYPEVIVGEEVYRKFDSEDDNLVLEMELPSDEPSVLVEVRSRNDSLIFFQIDLEYKISYSKITARDKGMSLYTEYFNMEDNPLKIDKQGKEIFHQGAIYKAKTTVLIKDDLEQSEIRIPIPAGLKAIDFNLNLTSEELFENLKQENENPKVFENLSVNEEDVVFYSGDKLYDSQMKRGVYTFTFYVRANIKGEYYAPGEWMQEMYLPGRGAWQDLREVKIV